MIYRARLCTLPVSSFEFWKLGTCVHFRSNLISQRKLRCAGNGFIILSRRSTERIRIRT